VHDFPNEWYKANNPPAGATERLLSLGNLYERLPSFARGRKPEKIEASDVYVLSPAALPLTLLTKTETIPLSGGIPIGPSMKLLSAHDLGIPMIDWQLKIGDLTTKIPKLWLIVRYQLKSPS
jgi:hypothetical protein